MKYRILTLTLFVLLMRMQSLLHAYPTGLNVIPSADILPAGNIRIGYESDGNKQPFDNGHVQYLYTQVGIRDRLEAGVDLYDVGGAKVSTFNAKLLLTPERNHLPELSVGVLNVANGISPGAYLVGTKNFGPLGVVAGAEHQSGDTWALVGAYYAVTPKFYLLGDYQSGSGRQGTVGAYYYFTPALGVNIYYAKNNTDSHADYVGAYIGYTFSAK